MHRPLEWSLLALLALSVICGGGEAKEYRKLGAEFVPAESGKRYNEPSCEQLRAMWRFSKRQARASEVTNEIPQYRDPFVYNVWEPYPGTLRSVGARTKTASTGSVGRRQRPVYGKIVHTPPPGSARSFDSPRTRAFEELTARMFGSSRSGGSRKTLRYTGSDGSLVPQAGSFQQLKDIVRAERARELQQRLTDDPTLQNYGQMVVSLPPAGEDDGAYGSFRYGKQEEPARVRGVLSFPDVLAPAAGRLDETSEAGFTEEAYPPEMYAPVEEEMAPVRLSAKAAKQRSSVTKGQRVYKASPRTKQGSAQAASSAEASSTFPFASDTSAEEETSPSSDEVLEDEIPPPCATVLEQTCTSSPECLCSSTLPTLSRCFHETPTGTGVCQIFDLHQSESDEFGSWHRTPLEPGQLGAWSSQVALPAAPAPAASTPSATLSSASSDRRNSTLAH